VSDRTALPLALAWTTLTSVATPHATLVVLPSLGTSVRVWEPLARALGDRWRIDAVDLPGHGASEPHDAPFSVRDLAVEVARGIDARIDTPVLLVGVSLGGAIALELAAMREVRGALIVNSGLRFGDRAGWDRLRAVVRVGGTAALAEESAAGWFSERFPQQQPELVEACLMDLSAVDDSSYRRCCDALEAFDGRTTAARVTTRVAAVGTADDPATPASGMRRLAAAIEGAHYVELAAGKHLANVEHPERLAALLEELGAADDRP